MPSLNSAGYIKEEAKNQPIQLHQHDRPDDWKIYVNHTSNCSFYVKRTGISQQMKGRVENQR